jgi:hypothetical protein
MVGINENDQRPRFFLATDRGYSNPNSTSTRKNPIGNEVKELLIITVKMPFVALPIDNDPAFQGLQDIDT